MSPAHPQYVGQGNNACGGEVVYNLLLPLDQSLAPPPDHSPAHAVPPVLRARRQLGREQAVRHARAQEARDDDQRRTKQRVADQTQELEAPYRRSGHFSNLNPKKQNCG